MLWTLDHESPYGLVAACCGLLIMKPSVHLLHALLIRSAILPQRQARDHFTFYSRCVRSLHPLVAAVLLTAALLREHMAVLIVCGF